MTGLLTHLCQLAGEWRGDIGADGTLAEEKIDGWRALYFRGRDGKPRLWTRNGLPIEGADHILYRLAQIERVGGEQLFIDGEFQVDGTLEATKRWCERGWKLGGVAGLFHAFDCLPQRVWEFGGGDEPLHGRKARLSALVGAVDEDEGLSWEWRAGSRGGDVERPVRLLTDSWLVGAGDVAYEARRVWAAGGEGLMLKDAEAPYRRNRNSAWRKVKVDGPWRRVAA